MDQSRVASESTLNLTPQFFHVSRSLVLACSPVQDCEWSLDVVFYLLYITDKIGAINPRAFHCRPRVRASVCPVACLDMNKATVQVCTVVYGCLWVAGRGCLWVAYLRAVILERQLLWGFFGVVPLAPRTVKWQCSSLVRWVLGFGVKVGVVPLCLPRWRLGPPRDVVMPVSSLSLWLGCSGPKPVPMSLTAWLVWTTNDG